MEKIRSYFTFTGWKYKLGIFIGLPAAVLALGLIWRQYVGALKIYPYFAMTGVIFAEIMTDQAVFNGIQARRGYKLDFLKTSMRGPQILRQGLTVDLVRRLLTAALCVRLSLPVWVLKGEWAKYLGMVLVVYGAEALGLWISRRTRSVTLCVFIAYGSILLGLIGFFLIQAVPLPGLWAVDGLLALAVLLLSLLTVRAAMASWRQTYYDSARE